MKEKLKVAMCVFLSLSIATLSVYCVGKNATGRFSIFENTALAAAYSTMPDGKIARNNAPAMNTPEKTEASEHSRQNVITKKTDGNEKCYPVSEVTLSDENVEGYNFSIRNTTSYNIDVEEMLGITTCARRSFVSRHKIPSKKEHGIAYYLRSAIEDVNNTLAKYSGQYYTVEQICEKFNMDRDKVYGMLRYSNVRKVHEGKFALFLKEDIIKMIHERQFT